jgi:hypothetical protein
MRKDEIRMVQLIGKSLYHYTDKDGLNGIFSNNNPDIHNEIRIRFSTASRFSDKKEGIHTIDLFHKVCRDFFADKKSDKELYEATQEITSLEESFIIRAGDISDAPTDILPRMPPIVIDYGRVETFIACFSESDDNQDLWHFENNRTSDFTIELHVQSDFQSWLPNGYSGEIPYEIRFRKVIYEDAKKKQKILEDLSESYNHNCANKDEFIDSLRVSLSEYQYLFKKYKYHREAETRAVIKVDSPARLSENGIKVKTPSDGMYIDVPMIRTMVLSVRIRSDVTDAEAEKLAAIARESVPNTTVLYNGRPILYQT